MMLKTITIDGFGCLVNRRFAFTPGINIVWGPNESGKSTLQACIAALLYGLKREGAKRAYFDADYDRYNPWRSDVGYSARMEYVLAEGEQIEVSRCFSKEREACSITELRSGREITASFKLAQNRERLFAPAHLGVSKTVFLSTAFITQTSLPTVGQDGRATQLLGALAASDDDAASTELQRALHRLKAALDSIGTEQTRVRGYGAAIKRRRSLVREYEELREKRAALAADQLDRNRLRDALRSKRDETAQLRREHKRMQGALAGRRYARAMALQRQCEALTKQAAELRTYEAFPSHLQSTVHQQQQRLQHLNQQRDDLVARIARTDAELREVVEAAEAFAGFADLPTDAAQQLGALQAHWHELQTRAAQLAAAIENKGVHTVACEAALTEATAALQRLGPIAAAGQDDRDDRQSILDEHLAWKTSRQRLTEMLEELATTARVVQDREQASTRAALQLQAWASFAAALSLDPDQRAPRAGIERWAARLTKLDTERHLHDQRLVTVKSRCRETEDRLAALHDTLEPLLRFKERTTNFSAELAGAAERQRAAAQENRRHEDILATTRARLESSRTACSVAQARFAEPSPEAVRAGLQQLDATEQDDGALRASLLKHIARREWESQRANLSQTRSRVFAPAAALAAALSLTVALLTAGRPRIWFGLAALLFCLAAYYTYAWRRAMQAMRRLAADLTSLRKPFAEQQMRNKQAQAQVAAWCAKLNLAGRDELDAELAAWEERTRQRELLEQAEQTQAASAAAAQRALQDAELALRELLPPSSDAPPTVDWSACVVEEQRAFESWQKLSLDREHLLAAQSQARQEEATLRDALQRTDRQQRELLATMQPALDALLEAQGSESALEDASAAEKLDALRRGLAAHGQATQQVERAAEALQAGRQRHADLQAEVDDLRRSLDNRQLSLRRSYERWRIPESDRADLFILQQRFEKHFDDAVRLRQEVQTSMLHRASARNELQQLETQRQAVVEAQQNIIEQLAVLAGPTRASSEAEIAQENVLPVIDELATRLDKFQALQQRRRDSDKEHTHLKHDLETLTAQAREAAALLSTCFKTAGVTDAQHFAEHHERAARFNSLREQLAHQEAMLAECLGSEDLQALCKRAAQFDAVDMEVPADVSEAEAQRLERRCRQGDEEAASLENDLSRLEERIRLALQGCREMAEVEEDVEQANAEVERLSFNRQALELAHDAVQQAAEEFHGRIGPELRQMVGRLVQRCSAGRYTELLIDDDFQVHARAPERGAFVRSDWLSAGTADLLPLLLRLALVEVFTRVKEPLPIFLDEVLVNFDRARFEAVLDLLVDTAQRHQVFYFTCHAEHAERLAQHAGAVLTLEAPAAPRS